MKKKLKIQMKVNFLMHLIFDSRCKIQCFFLLAAGGEDVFKGKNFLDLCFCVFLIFFFGNNYVYRCSPKR